MRVIFPWEICHYWIVTNSVLNNRKMAGKCQNFNFEPSRNLTTNFLLYEVIIFKVPSLSSMCIHIMFRCHVKNGFSFGDYTLILSSLSQSIKYNFSSNCNIQKVHVSFVLGLQTL